MTDHSHMKLGKRPRLHDHRTLRMARYLTSLLPAAPLAVDYTQGIRDWGMMLNDELGCCTIAALGHAIQAWSAASTQELTVPDSAIREYYEKWDGYNPADPGSDQGGVELDVLNDWRQQGFAGHTLDAFVAIDLGTRDAGYGTRDSVSSLAIQNSGLALGDSESFPPSPGTAAASPKPGTPDSVAVPRPVLPDIATAIWLFGGAYIGVELPVSAQNQDVWDVANNPQPDDVPGSWGGHAIYLVAYDSRWTMDDRRLTLDGNLISAIADPLAPIGNGAASIDDRQSTLSCITWGRPKKMTLAWFEKYCSEAYALVSKDWLMASGIAPCGFDLATLERDLAEVSGVGEVKKVPGVGCQVSRG